MIRAIRATTAAAAAFAVAASLAIASGVQAQSSATPPGAPPPTLVGKGKSSPPAPAAGHGKDTKCSACHTTESWGDVKFIHERTGFPLTGKHEKVTCRKCHPGDFQEPIGRACSSCHRDVHAGYAGIHCESCHDAQGWKSRFDTDAHRRTNFPLQGRHALIPCEECHGDRRDRSFARPTVDCAVCHQQDLARANSTGVSHLYFPGFPNLACLQCHSWWRWSPGSFPGHDRCFPIDAGNHAGIGCTRCHGNLLPNPLEIRSCSSTPWPLCFSCHGGCSAVTPEHTGVSNFTCSDQRCYQCHPGGTADEGGGGNLRMLRGTQKVRR